MSCDPAFTAPDEEPVVGVGRADAFRCVVVRFDIHGAVPVCYLGEEGRFYERGNPDLKNNQKEGIT